MEALKQTYDQFRKLCSSMSAGQRATLMLVPLMVAGGIFFLVRSGTGSSYVPLSLGKAFAAEEMAEASRTLSSAGLNDFRQNGQQILVPGDQVASYNAALVAGGSLPSGWASEWERKFDKQSGIFTSTEHLQNIKEIQLAKALREMIIQVPDVEDANVFWTPPKRHSWRRDSGRTATVWVKTRPGRELSLNLVRGIRHSVAGAIDDLKPENVVVFDQVKMTAFTPEHDGDPYSGRVLNQIKEFTSLYQQKISEQLKNDVKETVAKSIPKQASGDAVVVSSYVRGEAEASKADAPLKQTIRSILSQWGGAIGLAIFAICALRMIGKRVLKRTTEEETPADGGVILTNPLTERAVLPEAILLPSRRDELQSTVRENPEMAAAVLGKWLRSAH